MENSVTTYDNSDDSESKISAETITNKPKESKDSNAKGSKNASTSSTSTTRSTKITHIYRNDKLLHGIPQFKERSDVLVLFLQNNLIKKIQNLDSFEKLTHLYLQKNNIKTIENLDNLPNLIKLYLGHNEISVVENLENLNKLAELHIPRQQLKVGDVMVFEPICMDHIRISLTLLNISGNHLTELEPIIRLRNLSILVAKDNDLMNLNAIAYELSCLGNLKEAYLSGNPICKMPHYREAIIAKCRNLEIIDGQNISEQTRIFVDRMENRKTSQLSMKQELIKNKKIVVNVRKAESPNAHLMELEAKRLAAARSRELRLKQLDCSKGQIPRCFWRNITGKRVKEYVNQLPPENIEPSNVTFNDTNTFIWP